MERIGRVWHVDVEPIEQSIEGDHAEPDGAA
jgi:hypothetical protein